LAIPRPAETLQAKQAEWRRFAFRSLRSLATNSRGMTAGMEVPANELFKYPTPYGQ